MLLNNLQTLMRASLIVNALPALEI